MPRSITSMALAAVLLLPVVAKAEFTLDVTQTSPESVADGPTYPGTCTKEACRATLSVQVGGSVCVLNVRVARPIPATRGASGSRRGLAYQAIS